MIVTLDGQRVEPALGSDPTLQGVIDAIRESAPPGHLVVGVALDGRECTEQELEARMREPLTGVAQIDLETGSPTQLGVEALRAVAAQIDHLGQQQQSVADQLNTGEVADAIMRISDFVRAWQMVQQVLVQIGGLVGRNLTAGTFDGQSVEEHVNELLQRLREIRDALDARDMVLLADLISYEVPTLCETWRDLLNHLADTLPEAVAVE